MNSSDLGDLIDELEDIRALLPSAYGYADLEDEQVEVAEPGQIESVEIEVALTGLVDSFSDRLGFEETPTSFTEFLEDLFSPDDDIVSVASNLEDAINGYFGELFGENLELSDDYFEEIIKELKRRRDAWKRKKSVSKKS